MKIRLKEIVKSKEKGKRENKNTVWGKKREKE